MSMVALRKDSSSVHPRSEVVTPSMLSPRVLRVVPFNEDLLEGGDEQDPILAALFAETKIVDEKDAMILALDLGHKIRRRASDAIAAQANQDIETIKAILS